MKYLSIMLVLVGSAAFAEETQHLQAIKYHVGEKLVVVNDPFYNGCTGKAVTWRYTKNGEVKYELVEIKCRGLKDQFNFLRVIQDNLNPSK